MESAMVLKCQEKIDNVDISEKHNEIIGLTIDVVPFYSKQSVKIVERFH